MPDSKDNFEKKKKDSSSHLENNEGLPSELKTDRKTEKVRIPKFEKKDMYKIKYDF